LGRRSQHASSLERIAGRHAGRTSYRPQPRLGDSGAKAPAKKGAQPCLSSCLLDGDYLPEYLYRRYRQGKRLGKEITFFSIWYELRWGITSA